MRYSSGAERSSTCRPRIAAIAILSEAYQAPKFMMMANAPANSMPPAPQ